MFGQIIPNTTAARNAKDMIAASTFSLIFSSIVPPSPVVRWVVDAYTRADERTLRFDGSFCQAKKLLHRKNQATFYLYCHL